MNKEIIKAGFGIVTMFGVDEIVSNTIKHVNPQKMNLAKKICVSVASMAISGCILKAVNGYVNDTIDEVFDWAESMIKNISKKDAEGEVKDGDD